MEAAEPAGGWENGEGGAEAQGGGRSERALARSPPCGGQEHCGWRGERRAPALRSAAAAEAPPGCCWQPGPRLAQRRGAAEARPKPGAQAGAAFQEPTATAHPPAGLAAPRAHVPPAGLCAAAALPRRRRRARLCEVAPIVRRPPGGPTGDRPFAPTYCGKADRKDLLRFSFFYRGLKSPNPNCRETGGFPPWNSLTPS